MRVTIPPHWTAHQALLVYEFISDIQEAIWSRYGAELTEALRIEQGQEDPMGQHGEIVDLDEDVDF
jgi:hypothetical protein